MRRGSTLLPSLTNEIASRPGLGVLETLSRGHAETASVSAPRPYTRSVSLHGWRLLCLVIVAATGWIDLQTPLGVNVPAVYLTGILVASRCAARDAWLTTIGVTLLTAAGMALSPRGGDVTVGFVNRTLDVAIFWGALGIMLRGRAAATELARTVHTLSDFKDALDQSSIVAITDRRGRIAYANDKFCELSKYPREELLGQDHRMINSGHHPKAFMQDLWRTIGRGHVWHGEIKNRAKDGTYYWVDTTIIPFLDDRGTPYQYLAIRNEITARKEAEERLREQEALARLGQMAAIVAHEVRNPLAGILGSLHVLRSRLAGGAEGEVVDLMAARLRALNAMVDDLLKFARPKPPTFANVCAHSLLRDTAWLLRSEERLAGVTVDILGPGDVVLRADAEQLQQAFLNLFMNAAQAMHERGLIRVTVHAEGDRCEVAITDHGCGVLPDLRDRIFEPFFTTKTRGTGLGLAIVKRIVERQGGSVALASSSERGTTIVVTLPWRRSSDRP